MKSIRAALLALSLSFSLLPSIAIAGLNEGVLAFNNHDYTTAMRVLRPLAVQGDAYAQFVLGMMFLSGNGVAEDYKESARWFRLAADQGQAESQYFLGQYYFKGVGVGQDYAEAIRWTRLSANQGYAKAKTKLAEYEGAKSEQTNESIRVEEEAKRKAEEAARVAEDARLKAEEAARVAEEAKLKAEEAARLEEKARRKAERNVRIVSWIAALIGLAGVLIFFVRRRKHGAEKQEYPEKAQKVTVTSDSRFSKTNCLKCGYQRTPSDLGSEFSCPKCGAVYAKVEAALAEKPRQQVVKQVPIGSVPSSNVNSQSALQEVPNPSGIFGSLENVHESQTENSSVSIAPLDVVSPKTSLSTCKECGKSVSFKAKVCPHCGIKNPAPKAKKSYYSRILWVIAGIGVLAAIVYLSTSYGKGGTAIAEAKAWVEKPLIDPSSVQYRNVVAMPQSDKVSYYVCGEVNAKNRLGAYIGFKRFYFDTDMKDGSLEPDNDKYHESSRQYFEYLHLLACTPSAKYEAICKEHSDPRCVRPF